MTLFWTFKFSFLNLYNVSVQTQWLFDFEDLFLVSQEKSCRITDFSSASPGKIATNLT